MDLLSYVAYAVAIGLGLAVVASAFGWRFRRSLAKLIYAGGELPTANNANVELAGEQTIAAAPLVTSHIEKRRTSEHEAVQATISRYRRLTRSARRCHVLAGGAFWAAMVALQAWSVSTTATHDAWPLYVLHGSLPGLMVCAALAGIRWRGAVVMACDYLALTAIVTLAIGAKLGSISMATSASIELFLTHTPVGIGATLLLRRQVGTMLAFIVPSALFMLVPVLALTATVDALGLNAGYWRPASALLPIGAGVALLLTANVRLSRPRGAWHRLALSAIGMGAVGLGIDIWLPAMSPIGPLVLALPTFTLLGALFERLLNSTAASQWQPSLHSDILQYQACWFGLAMLAWVVLGNGWPDRPDHGWNPGQLMVAPAYVLYIALELFLLQNLRRAERTPLPKRLFLLRVFQVRNKRERLLDDLNDTWRRVGRIDLLGGPDLAMRTLNFPTWRCFLLDKLDTRFCRTAADLANRMATRRSELDIELRFPINEIYCYGDVWRSAGQQLARESDVVLLDLRGFTAANVGCKVEIVYLVHRIALWKVLILVDHTTNENDLNLVTQQAWRTMPADSPNASRVSPNLRLMVVDGHRVGDLVSRELVAIAYSDAQP